MTMINNLRAFEAYLRETDLAREHQIPHFCRWVRRFLQLELRHPELADDDKLVYWRDQVRRNNRLQAWQMDQAEQAARLYLGWRADRSRPGQASPPPATGQSRAISETDVLAQARELIRLRHYAFRPEHTYLEWHRRFLRFCRERRTDPWSPRAVKAFLSHLAVRRQVAAATQNQALHALLFLSSQLFHPARCEGRRLDKPLRRHPRPSCSACPGCEKPCHALLLAAAACRRQVLGEPPASRAGSGRRRGARERPRGVFRGAHR